MSDGGAINPPSTPMVDGRGNCTPEWYRYFAQRKRQLDGVAEISAVTTNDDTVSYPNSRKLQVEAGELTLTTGSATTAVGLADAGTAGTYGDDAHVVAVTVDEKGRVTEIEPVELNSDNITEGTTNLFFSEAAARASLSGGLGIDYDSSTGEVAIDTDYFTSGTYTPTLTIIANLDAFTAYACQYVKVGSVVTVSGRVDLNPTTTLVMSQLGISLPFASAFTGTNQCGGVGATDTVAGQSSAIVADAVNARAQMRWVPVDATNQPMFFTFTYLIV